MTTPGTTVALVSAGVLLRAVVVLVLSNPDSRVGYEDAHLTADIAAANHRFPGTPSAAATGGTYTRPPLFHWLCSSFPRRYLPGAFRYVSGLADAAVIGALGVAGHTLSLSPVALASGVSLLVLSPLVGYRRGDRPVPGGTGPLGTALLVWTVMLWVLWLQTGSALVLIASLVPGALVVLADRGATQTYLLTGLFVAGSGMPVVALVAGTSLLLSALLSRGGAVRLALGYAKASLDGMVRGERYAVRGSDDLGWSSGARAILDAPVVVAALATYAWQFTTGNAHGTPLVVELWLAAGLCLGLVTLPRKTRALGGPRLHVWTVVFPAVLVTGFAWDSSGVAYHLLVVAVLLVSLVRVGQLYSRESVETDSGWQSLLETLGDRAGGVVVVQPTERAPELAWKTGNTVVDCICNEPGSAGEIDLLFPARYRHVTDDIQVLRYYYDPDWVVFDRRAETVGLDPPDCQPTAQHRGYALYPFDALFD